MLLSLAEKRGWMRGVGLYIIVSKQSEEKKRQRESPQLEADFKINCQAPAVVTSATDTLCIYTTNTHTGMQSATPDRVWERKRKYNTEYIIELEPCCFLFCLVKCDG